jgi:hypothetical protein
MSRDIVLQGVILSYPHLFTPRIVQQGQDPKFSANFILPANFDWSQVQAAVQEAINEKWGANVPPNLKMPWDTVPALDKNNQPAPHAGEYFLKSNCQADSRPQVVDQNVNPIIDQSQIFAGCIVNAYVQAYGYDKQVNKGVSLGLNAIQLVDNVNVTRMGGGGRDATEVFQAVPGSPAPTAAPVAPGAAPAPAPSPAAPPAAAPAAPAAPAPGQAPAPVVPPAGAPSPAAPPAAAAPAAPVAPGAPSGQPWNQ